MAAASLKRGDGGMWAAAKAMFQINRENGVGGEER